VSERLLAFKSGLLVFLDGVRWYRSHPWYLLLAFLPLLVGLLLIGILLATFWGNREEWVSYFLFDSPAGGWKYFLWWVLNISVTLAVTLFIFIFGPIVADLLATPIYEIISRRIEIDFCSKPARDLNFWASIRLFREEVKKALAIVGLSLASLPLPVLNFLVPPFLVACELYDYSMSRRGFSFRDRVRFILKDIWAVLGFAMWFIIPFSQFLIMPLALAGGTILAARRLEKSDLSLYPLR
jgi:uncharacterized protein involved in cysteine biosynthesis